MVETGTATGMNLQQLKNGGKGQMIDLYKMSVKGNVEKKINGLQENKEEKTDEALSTEAKTALNGSYKDDVNHPEHYASSSIECIDAMEAMVDSQGRDYQIHLSGHMFYLWQVIFKYVWRWPFKEKPIEDLKKAEFYLKKLIKALEKTNSIQK
tara:strand:+ start:969 stop:1427 length:459 start_codon:yes stop_codon:yes gene_type:complete